MDTLLGHALAEFFLLQFILINGHHGNSVHMYCFVRHTHHAQGVAHLVEALLHQAVHPVHINTRLRSSENGGVTRGPHVHHHFGFKAHHAGIRDICRNGDTVGVHRIRIVVNEISCSLRIRAMKVEYFLLMVFIFTCWNS